MLLSILPAHVNLKDYRILRRHALRAPPLDAGGVSAKPSARRRLHLTYHYRALVAQAEAVGAL